MLTAKKSGGKPPSKANFFSDSKEVRLGLGLFSTNGVRRWADQKRKMSFNTNSSNFKNLFGQIVRLYIPVRLG